MLELQIGRRRIGQVAGSLAAMLVCCLIFAAPLRADDLNDLIAKNKIRAEIIGSTIREVNVRLRRVVGQSERIEVRIPVGTYFVSGNSSTQNMISTAERTTWIFGKDDWITVTVPTACANKPLNIPAQNEQMFVGVIPPSQQADLSTAMRALDAEKAPYPVIQAAVWIITDNATYDGMGTLVRRPANAPSGPGTRVIEADDAAHAMKVLADAGINIHRKAIWQRDRNRLVSIVKDEALKEWLNSSK